MSDQNTQQVVPRVHSAEFWRELGELGRFALTEGVRASAGKLDAASLMTALDGGVLADMSDAGDRIKAVYKAALDFGGKLFPVLDKWLERYKEASYLHAMRERERPQYPSYAADVLYQLAESKEANAPEVIRIYRKHGADPFFEQGDFRTYRTSAADRAFGAGRPDLLAPMLEGMNFTVDNPLPPLENADRKTLLHRASKLGTIDVQQYRACLRVIGQHIDPEYRQPYHDLYDTTVASLLNATRSIGVATWDRISNVAEVLIAGARPDDPGKWLNLTTVILEGKVFFPAEVMKNPNASDPDQVLGILLSEAGLDPNLEYEGLRLLHIAAHHNYPRVVEQLLEAGADHRATTFSYNQGEDKRPKTPRDIAQEFNFVEVTQVIDAFAAKSAISSVLARRTSP